MLLTQACNIASSERLHSADIDKIVTEWNVATILSIEAQIEKDCNERSLYMNRLDAFKALEGITDVSASDSSSLRFKFLRLLEKESLELKDVYIIEHIKSGEQIEPWIYVVSPKTDNRAVVNYYRYRFPEWKKEGSKKT